MADAAELGMRWFQAIEAGDVEGALSLLTDDVEFETPSGPMHGIAAVRPFAQGYVDGFPDGKFEIRSEVSSRGRAAMEGVYSGTNDGPMATPMGELPATRKRVAIPFVTIFETDDGERLRSHRVYWDQVSFMMQLGLMGDAPQG